MHRSSPLALLVLATFLAPAAQAACEYPANVTIPEGKSASQEEITAASAAVKKAAAAV